MFGGGAFAVFVAPLVKAITRRVDQRKEGKKLLPILAGDCTNDDSKSEGNTNRNANTTNTTHVIVPQLNLSGDRIDVRITSSYIHEVLCPIVVDVQKTLSSADNNGRTVFIGIVGGSGSGKTTLSQLLVRCLNGLSIPAVAISMDNYHFPNAHLDNTTHPHMKDDQGQPIKLRKVKGRSETIDSGRMLLDLKRIANRNNFGDQQCLMLPMYDRNLHDPVENRLAVTWAHRVVIVEGLHLMKNLRKLDSGECCCWGEIRNMLDTLYYLRFDDCNLQKERVMQRRMRGGISREW